MNPGKSWDDYVAYMDSSAATATVTPTTTAGSGGLFDNWSMAGVNDAVGALGGLYSMYQGNQFLNMAKDDMNLRRQSYYDNKNRRDRFENNTSAAFK
jgi:hypothetical protein